MRMLARIGLTLAGLALAVPAASRAQAPDPASPAAPTAKRGGHKLLRPRLGKHANPRLCADCQRRKLMAEKGVNVPPPPMLPPGTVPSGSACAVCGGLTTVVSGKLTPAMMLSSGTISAPSSMTASAAPGRAVVGDEPPGFAAVGPEPTPIGVVQPRLAAGGYGAGAGVGVGAGPAFPRDPSVMATSASAASVTPAREPVSLPGTNRPHILSHLIGVTAIGRDFRANRERQRMEQHASISYGSGNEPVTELPASMVYGGGGR
jgi:hypothetical protein